VEVVVVVVVAAVLFLIATLSVYRGKAAADQLTCEDNMQAMRSALEIYWTKHRDPVTQAHTYPADQAAFEAFLQEKRGSSSEGVYFPEEPLCPVDDEKQYHYQYSYNAATGVITIECPVPGSGHGS
jgi:type II secretory pathway pseudopilin PulG